MLYTTIFLWRKKPGEPTPVFFTLKSHGQMILQAVHGTAKEFDTGSGTEQQCHFPNFSHQTIQAQIRLQRLHESSVSFSSPLLYLFTFPPNNSTSSLNLTGREACGYQLLETLNLSDWSLLSSSLDFLLHPNSQSNALNNDI